MRRAPCLLLLKFQRGKFVGRGSCSERAVTDGEAEPGETVPGRLTWPTDRSVGWWSETTDRFSGVRIPHKQASKQANMHSIVSTMKKHESHLRTPPTYSHQHTHVHRLPNSKAPHFKEAGSSLPVADPVRVGSAG